MATRKRNLSSPLAASEFDIVVTPMKKKKKKRTVKVTTDKKTGSRTLTVKKRSGATRTRTISGDGTKVTRTKTNRKGEQVRKTTRELTKPVKGVSNLRVTKEKKGKPTKSEILKHYDSPNTKQELDYKKTTKKNVKKARKLYGRDTDNKAAYKKAKKEEREYDRTYGGKNKQKKKKRKKLKSFKQIGQDIKEACKGKQKGTKKCASMRKRF